MCDRVVTTSEAETEAVAERLGESLGLGDVVLLDGGLGAGKTVFVRGLARALGVDPDEVCSPTFTIVHLYRGRVPLAHVDLYRLAPGDVDDLGLDELQAGGVVAVEWAERLPRAIPGATRVSLADEGEGRRRVEIRRQAHSMR
jgi:tRNA threonylcarbamoyladenosine biosynthesis protein TsaE